MAAQEAVNERGRVVRTIELEPVQARYVERMMERYRIPDLSKAMRVLVNYAMAVPEEEERIFRKTRCRHCI